MNNPVGWFEIYVNDTNRAKKFYETVFQVKLEKLDTEPEMLMFPGKMDEPGSSGALVKGKLLPKESGGNNVLVYFNCDDCAIEQARAVESGGTVYKGKSSIGEYGFVSLVFDSECNIIGLYSKK